MCNNWLLRQIREPNDFEGQMRRAPKTIWLVAIAAISLAACSGQSSQPTSGDPESVTTTGSTDDTQYFTWQAASDGANVAYTTVLDSKSNQSLVVARDAETGDVTDKFGFGGLAAGILGAADGTVHVARGTDATIDVYAKGPTGYDKQTTWTVTVPGETGAVMIDGLARTADGIFLTTAHVGNPFTPTWVGVVALDSNGKVVGSWKIPDTIPNAYVIPIDVADTSGDGVFVLALPCADGLCGSSVGPNGYLYKLDVSAAGAIELSTEWQSPEIVGSSQLAAVDDTHVISASFSLGDDAALPPRSGGLSVTADQGGPANQAIEFELTATQLVQVGTLTGTESPSYVALNRRGPNPGAYLVEHAAYPSNKIVIERFSSSGTDWTRVGSTWQASWGPSGP